MRAVIKRYGPERRVFDAPRIAREVCHRNVQYNRTLRSPAREKSEFPSPLARPIKHSLHKTKRPAETRLDKRKVVRYESGRGAAEGEREKRSDNDISNRSCSTSGAFIKDQRSAALELVD